MQALTGVVFGSTGLIVHHLIDGLLADDDYGQVIIGPSKVLKWLEQWCDTLKNSSLESK